MIPPIYLGETAFEGKPFTRVQPRALAPFIPLVLTKRAKDIEYEAKAVTLAGRRYIVCRNRDEMRKDAAARAAILAALERRLKKGDKSLVGNKGYRRFLATPNGDHFAIDRAKAEEDAKFDGVFVLRTNADLSPLEAMLCYKQLWMVERAFRTSKSLFATRPIFHKLDETIRGHVSCSFLALLLKKELEDRVANINALAVRGVEDQFEVLGIGGAEQGGGGGVAWGERADVWALAGALRGGRGGRAVGPAAGRGVEPHLSPRHDKVALNLALSSDRHHRRPSQFPDDPIGIRTRRLRQRSANAPKTGSCRRRLKVRL